MSCQVFFSTPTSSLYDAARFGGNNAAMMESMGAQPKQKEGEVLQLQVLLSEQSKVKETMTRELTRLTILADQVIKEKLSQLYFTKISSRMLIVRMTSCELVPLLTLLSSLLTLSSSLSQSSLTPLTSSWDPAVPSLRNISHYPPCAYDEDCVPDHKCMQYMCYPWKTSTGF